MNGIVILPSIDTGTETTPLLTVAGTDWSFADGPPESPQPETRGSAAITTTANAVARRHPRTRPTCVATSFQGAAVVHAREASSNLQSNAPVLTGHARWCARAPSTDSSGGQRARVADDA